MAEKHQQAYPLAPADGYTRSDEEAASLSSDELRRQKRKKYIIYGVAFVEFQVFVLTIMGMTIMKFRNPKFRVRSATFGETFEVGNAANPSFNIAMNTEFGIKNNNFGPFKYQNTTVDFYYRGRKVGDAFIRRSTANIRATRKVDVTVNFSSTNLTSNSELANDISS